MPRNEGADEALVWLRQLQAQMQSEELTGSVGCCVCVFEEPHEREVTDVYTGEKTKLSFAAGDAALCVFPTWPTLSNWTCGTSPLSAQGVELALGCARLLKRPDPGSAESVPADTHDRIVADIDSHPGTTLAQVAQRTGLPLDVAIWHGSLAVELRVLEVTGVQHG